MIMGLLAENQGHPLGPGTFDLFHAEMPALGMVRISATYAGKPWAPLPDHELIRLVMQVREAAYHPLVIVRDASQVRRLPREAEPWVNYSNEPDLKIFGWNPPSAKNFLKPLKPVIEACEELHYPLTLPAISNTNERGFEFNAQIPWHDIPAFVIADFHRYSDGDHPFAHPNRKDRLFTGADHREREIAHFRKQVGLHEIGCSEIGYKTRPLTEAQVAEYMAWERTFLAAQGCVYAVAHNLDDGDLRDENGRYGFRDSAGRWKPVAKAWAGEAA